jgi:tetratricopeptide (TPR) repeat protein
MAAEGLAEPAHDVQRLARNSSTNGPPGASTDLVVVWAQALTWQACFCRRLGQSERARELVQQSLGLSGASASTDLSRIRAHALYVLGEIERGSGKLEKAEQPYAQALALYRALGQRWEMGETLSALADAAQGMGAFDRAKELRQEGLALRRELGDRSGLVRQLLGLAITFRSLGQFDECERLGREGLATAREMGDRDLICRGLLNLAGTLTWKGEYAESRLLLEEGLRISNDLSNRLYWPFHATQRSLGLAMAHLGEYEAGRACLQRALALAQEADSSWFVGIAFYGLGLLALAESDHVGARQHLQQGLAIMQQMGQRVNVGWFFAAQAGAARGLGRSSEARELLRQALKMSAEIQDLLTPLYALPVAALLLADAGETERAVAIYALASRYGFVARSRLWQDIAGQHIVSASAALSPQAIEAARERGRAQDLRATVEALLAEEE